MAIAGTHGSKLGTWLLIVSLAFSASGCLEGDAEMLVSYNPKNDEFTVLSVFQQIRVVREKKDGKVVYDLQSNFMHLQNLWLNRDHLIVPADVPFWGFSNAALRVSNTTYRLADLRNPGLSPPCDSPIPLDAIRIRPGGFFLDARKSLCSYQQIVVPGSILDSLVSLELKHQLRGASVDEIDKEIERRNAGGAKSSWQQYADFFIRQDPPGLPDASDLKPPATQAAQTPGDEPEPLDADSLKLLRNAVLKHDVRVTRSGSVFTIRLPFSAADSKDGVAAFEQVRVSWASRAENRLRELAVKHAEFASEIESVRTGWKGLADTTTAKAAQGGLDFSIDVVKWSECKWHTDRLSQMLSTADSEVDVDTRKRAAEMAKFASNRLPIDHDLNVGKIYTRFHAGTLPSHPSTKPVEPGFKLSKLDGETTK